MGRLACLGDGLVDRLAFGAQVLHELLSSARRRRRQPRLVAVIQREVGENLGSEYQLLGSS